MARTLFVGPYMYLNGKKTDVKWCSATLRPLQAPEISASFLWQLYYEIKSAIVNKGAENQRVACRADQCSSKSKAAKTMHFIEITEGVHAGPLCLQCVNEHVRNMARVSGETSDIQIYQVLTSASALQRILDFGETRTGKSRDSATIDRSVRMF